ncbi:MAG: hypothetical protein M1819_001522 [Sarea resinae]|nr:MAG: hypothetical protein M1819_001522 [Sarea resinae]
MSGKRTGEQDNGSSFREQITKKQKTSYGKTHKSKPCSKIPNSESCPSRSPQAALNHFDTLAETAEDIPSSRESVANYVALSRGDLSQTPKGLNRSLKEGSENISSKALKDESPTSESPGRTYQDSSRLSKAPIPPLPPIKDARLAVTPFIHQGSLDAQQSSSGNASYERLEFLGDAYIEIVSSRYLYDRFPTVHVGELCSMRELLVKNETLAEYALLYGFDERAPTSKALRDRMTGKARTKILADMFEAYVAAVVLASPQDGLNTIERWLIALWAPKFASGLTPLDSIIPDAKQDLSKKVGGKEVKVEYVEEREPEMIKREGKSFYYIGVYLTGWGYVRQHLGSGKAISKKKAGLQAATNALANKPLIDCIAAIKHDFDAKVKREREKDAISGS